MITFHAPGEKAVVLTDLNLCAELTRRAVWIDLFEPTREEENAVEAALGIDVPTRAEMQEIELSSRLYRKGDTLFMTATVLTKADTSRPESAAVTFILSPAHGLITVRYTQPIAFEMFRARREADPGAYGTAHAALAGLMDAVVERAADILEGVGAGLDEVSAEIFGAVGGPDKRGPTRNRDFDEILRRIGRFSDLVSRARESLVSFNRVVSFLRETPRPSSAPAPAPESLAHLPTLAGDLASLGDHASFLAGKVAFLLDATLGMISNEQNAIVKLISVAAVVIGPPTLIAGIYGMNFERLPELKWAYGYPFALGLMALSAAVPYFIFKRKGWL